MTTKSILITGCSSGIGYTAAHYLKDRGFRVFASARKSEDVEKLKNEGFESIQLDVNDASSIQKALVDILSLTQGTLDALFNNAGFVQVGAIEDLTPEAYRSQFDTNVFGPLELTKAVLPIMRKQGHGRIIQNSSILGIVSLPYYGAYNASKFALEGFSNTLRMELRGTNIHVSIINPGPISTDIRKNAYKAYERTLRGHETGSPYEKVYKNMEERYFSQKEKDKLAVSPEVVAKKLLHALESTNPKAHYYVGLPANFLNLMRRILPDSALDWLLSKTS